MHHLVFGINFQIHSVSLTILVSIHLLIHFSTHLCHHPHSRHPSLLHSFTPGSNLPFQQILPTVDFFYPLDCLTITGLGRITLIILFLVSHFNFLFIPCGRLSWLPVSFLLHVKYTLSYRIVSCPTLSAPAPAPDKAVQRRPNVSSRWATPAQSRLKPTQGGSSGTEGKKSRIKKKLKHLRYPIDALPPCGGETE